MALNGFKVKLKREHALKMHINSCIELIMVQCQIIVENMLCEGHRKSNT